ncbi:MAG TPA: hypothetical protein VEY11_09050 [Pyrinomonadaceae bacterium]|nr:hypothetical protein [Pyrinomonadaceae bacterium]
MALVFIILLAQVAIVIPLAIRRGNIGRVLLIACLLEAGKFLFLLLLVIDFLNWLPYFVTLCFIYIIYPAEWLAMGARWPNTLATIIAVLCDGVAWNLAAAYWIASRVPGKMSKTAVDA